MREEYGAKFGYDVPVPDAVARKFMPWIDFEQGLIPDLNISEQFVLSYLTNEACIYARSDMGLSLPLSKVVSFGRSLVSGRILSRDTLNRAMNSLQTKGLITFIEGKHNPYLTVNLGGRYQTLLRVDPSARATDITTKWAMSRIADRVDNPAMRCERALNANLLSRRSDRNVVDVLMGLPEGNGMLVVTDLGYYDVDGTYTRGHATLPYFEQSLAQTDVPRHSYYCEYVDKAPVPPALPSPLPESIRYTDVCRTQFYQLSDADQWKLTLDQALDDPALVESCTKLYKEKQVFFTSEAKKAILLDGLESSEYGVSAASADDTEPADGATPSVDITTEPANSEAPATAEPAAEACTDSPAPTQDTTSEATSEATPSTGEVTEEATAAEAADPAAKRVVVQASECAKEVQHSAKRVVHNKNVLKNVAFAQKERIQPKLNKRVQITKSIRKRNEQREMQALTAYRQAAQAAASSPAEAEMIADGWDPNFIRGYDLTTYRPKYTPPKTKPAPKSPEAQVAQLIDELVADGWDPKYAEEYARGMLEDQLADEQADEAADHSSSALEPATYETSGAKIDRPPSSKTAQVFATMGITTEPNEKAQTHSVESKAGLEAQDGANHLFPAGPSKPEASTQSGALAKLVAELIADGWAPQYAEEYARGMLEDQLADEQAEADHPSSALEQAPDETSGGKIEQQPSSQAAQVLANMGITPTESAERNAHLAFIAERLIADGWDPKDAAAHVQNLIWEPSPKIAQLVAMGTLGTMTVPTEAEAAQMQQAASKAGLESQDEANHLSPAGPNKPLSDEEIVWQAYDLCNELIDKGWDIEEAKAEAKALAHQLVNERFEWFKANVTTDAPADSLAESSADSPTDGPADSGATAENTTPKRTTP